MVSNTGEAPSYESEPLRCDSLGISVVVPTFKRVELCQTLFASLRDSRKHLRNPVEVLVIDDSPPPEAHQIEKMCAEYGGRYYFKKRSVSGKRNFGACVASHPIVLFIDSDCAATPHLLKEHLATYTERPDVVAVLGRTEFKGPESFTWKSVQFTSLLNDFRLGDSQTEVVWGPSNNLSYRRDTFMGLGGFDESFTNKVGSEDVELGIRLYRQGMRVMTNPLAVVHHSTETWSTMSQMIRRLFTYGRGNWHVGSKHRDSLQFGGPNATFLFLVAVPIALVCALITSNVAWLTLPLWFPVLRLSTQIVMHIGQHPARIAHPTRLIVAELLALVPEIGTTAECFKRRWFRPLFCHLVVQKEGSLFIRNVRMLPSWIPSAQLVASFLLVALINFIA